MTISIDEYLSSLPKSNFNLPGGMSAKIYYESPSDVGLEHNTAILEVSGMASTIRIRFYDPEQVDDFNKILEVIKDYVNPKKTSFNAVVSAVQRTKR